MTLNTLQTAPFQCKFVDDICLAVSSGLDCYSFNLRSLVYLLGIANFWNRLVGARMCGFKADKIWTIILFCEVPVAIKDANDLGRVKKYSKEL